jgi:hypothetical protein
VSKTGILALAVAAGLAAVVAWSQPGETAGAIASGGCGRFGYAINRDTAAMAERAAVADCRKKGAAPCEVYQSFAHRCVALALDGDHRCDGARGWAEADALGPVRRQALDYCRHYAGRRCIVAFATCDN